jgi:putative hydrolase of the HAD superfamily
MVSAVVFDLWQTLAEWPEVKSAELRRAWSDELGVTEDRLNELWYGGDLYRLRETGPIAPAIEQLYEVLGVNADLDDVLRRRLQLNREALVPVAGAVSTLLELRRRGVATGLISNCTEEVALVWDETPFAGLLDVTIFSATAGCMKPEPEIYARALAGLGVAAAQTLFIGDGANDELAGAKSAGMKPVLVQLDGLESPWDGLDDWSGPRVTAIPQILELVT